MALTLLDEGPTTATGSGDGSSLSLPLDCPEAPEGELVPAGGFVQLIDWAIAAYLVRYGSGTRLRYRTGLRRWLAWCSSHELDPLLVRRPHIEAWARWLEEDLDLAARTVASYLTPVLGLYTWAHRDELIPTNPAAYVQPPRTPRVSTTQALTREELAAVLAVAAAHPDPAVDALVHILGLNGTRWSETLGIDIDHLGTHGLWQIVHLPHRKGGGVADLSLSAPTQRAIAHARGDRETGPLLINWRTGRRLHRNAARGRVRAVLHEAGITRRITPHSFRHSFVTLALDANVDWRDLMASTGHNDPSMIVYYDRARAAIERNATHAVTAWVQAA